MDREEQEKELEEIFNYYKGVKEPGSQDNLVTMLREIQEVCGFIPPDLQQRAADAAGVKLTSVTCLMKLYKSLKPAAYRHKIVICTGPRCMAKNSDLPELIRRKLAVGKDGLSADGSVFLDTANCLKHCKTSPNMMIDGKVYTDLTEEKVIELLQKLDEKLD